MLLWDCKCKCQVSIHSKFLQLSWQVFKEVLSKQKPSRTEKKKKKKHLTCLTTNVSGCRSEEILHNITELEGIPVANEMSLYLLLSLLFSKKRVFSNTTNGHSHCINRKYLIKSPLDSKELKPVNPKGNQS